MKPLQRQSVGGDFYILRKRDNLVAVELVEKPDGGDGAGCVAFRVAYRCGRDQKAAQIVAVVDGVGISRQRCHQIVARDQSRV